MVGFLLQWPTLLTLAMFPVLVWMYVRLARHEEREALGAFADAYRDYMDRAAGRRSRWRDIATVLWVTGLARGGVAITTLVFAVHP